MKYASTENEKELLECLHSVLGQACYTKDGDLDSFALTAYAWGMHLLADYGKIIITAESGRRVIAKEKK